MAQIEHMVQHIVNKKEEVNESLLVHNIIVILTRKGYQSPKIFKCNVILNK